MDASLRVNEPNFLMCLVFGKFRFTSPRYECGKKKTDAVRDGSCKDWKKFKVMRVCAFHRK